MNLENKINRNTDGPKGPVPEQCPAVAKGGELVNITQSQVGIKDKLEAVYR